MKRLRYALYVAFWLWLLSPAYADTITFQLPAANVPAGETAVEWQCGWVTVRSPVVNGRTLPTTCTVEVSPFNQYAIGVMSLPSRAHGPVTLLIRKCIGPLCDQPEPPKQPRGRIVGKGGPK
jgi:hypothetical protein